MALNDILMSICLVQVLHNFTISLVILLLPMLFCDFDHTNDSIQLPKRHVWFFCKMCTFATKHVFVWLHGIDLPCWQISICYLPDHNWHQLTVSLEHIDNFLMTDQQLPAQPGHTTKGLLIVVGSNNHRLI